MVGIVNNGNPIGVYETSMPNLLNYINSIEYGVGTPEVLNAYDDMFVGLDGYNYAVNSQTNTAGLFSGKNIAIINSESSAIMSLISLPGNTMLQVTPEGNIVSSTNTDELYCYMKNNSYARVKMDISRPAWASSALGIFYPIGNKLYTQLANNRMWVAIDGANCKLDWSDIRSILMSGTYSGATYQISTTNNRVLYGIWDAGGVLYYPYPAKN